MVLIMVSVDPIAYLNVLTAMKGHSLLFACVACWQEIIITCIQAPQTTRGTPHIIRLFTDAVQK